MAIAELALIVVVVGAMAIVFGAQERREERRTLAWAEETHRAHPPQARARPGAPGDRVLTDAGVGYCLAPEP